MQRNLEQRTSKEAVIAIGREYGLGGEPAFVPSNGVVNQIWRFGNEAILRITVEEDQVLRIRAEEVASRVWTAQRISAPRLIAIDESRRLCPHPFTIYEWIAGGLLGDVPQEEPTDWIAVALGCELAKLHAFQGFFSAEEESHLYKITHDPPEGFLEAALGAGGLSQAEADEVRELATELAAAWPGPLTPKLLHNDLHAWNVMLDWKAERLTGIIDWSDAGIGDPAIEFAGMPLPFASKMLSAYQNHGGQIDRGFRKRTVYAWLERAIWEICALDTIANKRHWWRWPKGGWPVAKRQIQEFLG